jgi:hypothetical protein
MNARNLSCIFLDSSQAKNTFNVNFDQIYQEWKAVHYGWLPTAEELSKSLGDKVPHEVLEKLDVRSIQAHPTNMSHCETTR